MLTKFYNFRNIFKVFSNRLVEALSQSVAENVQTESDTTSPVYCCVINRINSCLL